MPKEVWLHAKNNCKKNSKIGILATEGTLKTNVYHKFFNKNFKLISPKKSIQIKNVNKAIKFVKMGKIALWSKQKPWLMGRSWALGTKR